MEKNLILMIGGARGVGKSKLTIALSNITQLPRIETRTYVQQYLSQVQRMSLTDYITGGILNENGDLLLDTHYIESPREITNPVFKMGLTKDNLESLSKKFEVYPCLIEVSLDELHKRRLNDSKNRLNDKNVIERELKFTREAYIKYLQIFNRDPFILINDDFNTSIRNLAIWANKIKGQQNAQY